MICKICPRACDIPEGKTGYCQARTNRREQIVAENYGIVTALSLDPVEKKPLRGFFPGSTVLSAGSYGCNLRCSFCQNHNISMTKEPLLFYEMKPVDLLEKAMQLQNQGNIGLAYTYNEPLIGFEFVKDCAKLVSEKGMKNIVVTNGYVCREPLMELLPFIDAWNIDLKSFSPDFYKEIGGDVEIVKETIALAAAVSHVEVTTLIIPGKNDSDEEMKQLAAWLSSIDSAIPLHVSRFFPAYRMTDRQPTPVSTILRLAEIARSSLQYVYEGNV